MIRVIFFGQVVPLDCIDNIYEEVDGAKADIETLRADNRGKGQVSESE